MRVSLFSILGFTALASLGVAGPVAYDNHRKSVSWHKRQTDNPATGGKPAGTEITGGTPGGGNGGTGDPKSKSKGSKGSQGAMVYCSGSIQGDISQLCSDCGGTLATNAACSSTDVCKNPTDGCITDQKCQQTFGQDATVLTCGDSGNTGTGSKGKVKSGGGSKGKTCGSKGDGNKGGGNTNKKSDNGDPTDGGKIGGNTIEKTDNGGSPDGGKSVGVTNKKTDNGDPTDRSKGGGNTKKTGGDETSGTDDPTGGSKGDGNVKRSSQYPENPGEEGPIDDDTGDVGGVS